MRRSDVIIVVTILVIAGVFWGTIKYKEYHIKKNSNMLRAQIHVGNQLYKEVVISDNHTENIEIKTNLGKNVIKIHDNGVEVIEADCDDHICEKMGFKNKAGEIIVCLPNQVFVEIKGNQEAALDEISR